METVSISKRINWVLISLLLTSCLPKLQSINGNNIESKKYYLVDNTSNEVKIKSNRWKLDSLQNAQFNRVNEEDVSVYVRDDLSYRQNVIFCFSSILGRSKKIIIRHGVLPSPVVRVYPKVFDTLSFNNLRFFKLSAVNNIASPELIYYYVDSFDFSYNDQLYHSNSSYFTNENMNDISTIKPLELEINRLFIRADNEIFNIDTSFKIALTYSRVDDFSCLDIDNKSSCDFKELLQVNSYSNTLDVHKDTNKCEIFCFYNLGTQFKVEIKDNSGNLLYSKFLEAGEISIDNYFLFENMNEMNITITGDFNWTGKVLVQE